MSTESNNNQSFFNPFPGLRPFKVEESHLFFGREGQSEEILKKLSDEKFVAVIGASGSGKSSLIYCGLVPTLYGGFIGDTNSKWNIIAARPGNAPIENLSAAILEKTEEKGQEEERAIKQKLNASILRSSSNGLVELLNQSFNFKEESVLIIVDQFEELFRYKSSRKDQSTYNESEAFVKLLVNANKNVDAPVYVVLTMRSDFIGECSQFYELTELINESNYLIPQMTREDFRSAIEGPVAVGGATIETQLVQQLLNEVGDNPDQLPILQHALMRTWDYWMDHSDKNQPISIADYEAIGKMEQALSEHANEAYDELNEDQKWICESMFKTITEKGNDNRGIRHPTSVTDIAQIAQAPVKKVIEVIEPFRAAGRSFITPSYEIPLDKNSIIDLSHESLMRIWNKLKVWVEEEWNAVQMYMRISEASEMYQIGSTGLWRPPDLQLALNWREKQKPTLAWAQRYNPAFERAMVYLETSDKAYRAEEENKVKLQKRQLRRSKVFAVILGTAAIIGMGLTVYSQMMKAKAVEQQRIATERKVEADKQREIAEEQTQIAKQQEQEALLSKEEADQQRRIAVQKEREARRSFERAEKQTKLAVQREKEATEQRTLADKNAAEARKQSEEAEKARQEAYQRRMLSISQSMSVKSRQILDDIQLKALIAYQAFLFNQDFEGPDHNPDIYLGLYDALKAVKGQYFNAVNGHAGSVMDIAFAPHTNILYSTGGDGKVLKWNIENLKASFETVLENSFGQKALGITQDGSWLICATDEGKIILLNLLNSVETDQELVGHSRIVSGIVAAPNNEYFISASIDKTIRKWSLEDFQGEIFIHTESKINSIDISPDSEKIIAGMQDGTIKIWNLKDTAIVKVIENDGIPFSTVKYSTTGNRIATGDSKGNIKIWNAENYQLIDDLEGRKSRINDIDFDRHDKLMATALQDGTAMIWDFTSLNNQPIELTEHESWVLATKFSPDGKSLVTTSKNQDRIIVWPIHINEIAKDLRKFIIRNLSQEEWNMYVADDIDYETTITDLNNPN